PAIHALQVQSLGRRGTATQAPGGDLDSEFDGAVRRLSVLGDIVSATVNTFGDFAEIGALNVGGSIVGGRGGSYEGIATITIGGDVLGGADDDSGAIYAFGTIENALIKGSIVGAAGDRSASIFANAGIGSVTVGGSVIGGAGLRSASICGGAGIAS